MVWVPPPDRVTWEMSPPLSFGSATYSTVTLRAPTVADLMKATAVPGETGTAITIRLIAAVSGEGVPVEALRQVPSWQVEQMSTYFDMFNGAPMPGPLVAYAAAVLAATTSLAPSDGAPASS